MNGYLPHRIVKAVAFWVLTACILLAMAAGLLYAWDTILAETASRCVWTAFILSSGTVLFLVVNLLFGEMAAEWFGGRSGSPPIDPAFAERLRKAKDLGTAETQRKVE